MFKDIFSSASETLHRSKYGSAKTYTSDTDNHSYIYCEISILSTLLFPKYTCRIPNISGQPVPTQEFKLVEGSPVGPSAPMFIFSKD